MSVLVTCFAILFVDITKGEVNPKSVHIALETALTFNNNDKSANLKFIDDFQSFLSKVRKSVDNNNKDTQNRKSFRDYKPIERDHEAPVVSNQKFSDVLIELINILENYQDEDLEDVFAVIDDEFRNYNYKNCKFNELVSDDNVRRIIEGKFRWIKEKSAKYLRKNLIETLQFFNDAKLDPMKSELLAFIDSLYTKNDVKKIKSFSRGFYTYQSKSKRANMDLISLVRDTIRNVIFDHYSNLNVIIRRNLKARLETFFWKNVTKRDNVHRLEWTIQYKNPIEKAHHYLRHISRNHTGSRSIKEFSTENENEFDSSNEKDKNKSNAKNINLKFENLLDIVKLSTISISKKKYNTPVTESENISANKINTKPEINKKGLELHMVSTEQIMSDSKEDSASSDEYEVSGTNTRYDTDERRNTIDISDVEENLTTKKQLYKKSKFKSLSVDASSVEIGRYKNFKGFTDNYIMKSSYKNKNLDNMLDYINNSKEIKSKSRNKNNKMKTSLNSRNRMHTLRKESHTTKKHDKKRDEVVANKCSDENVDKTPEVVDFTQNAYLEKFYSDEEQGLKFKAAAPKETKYGKKTLITEIITDGEKPRKSKNSITFSKRKIKTPLPNTNKRINDVTQYKTLGKFSKRKVSRSKQRKTVEYPGDKETYKMSPEDKIIITTKLPRKVKASFETQTSATSKQQKTDQSNYSSQEETQTRIKKTKRPKRAKIPSKKTKSTTYKSVEKPTEEDEEGELNRSSEEIRTTTKLTKKENKLSKNITFIDNSVPEYNDTIENSIKETNDSVKKEKLKKKHKKQENKHHIHKIKHKNVVKSLEEGHVKYIGKETLLKKYTSKEKQLQEKKHLFKHKNTNLKSVPFIFISVENKEYQPIKPFKIVKNSEKIATASSFPTEPTTTASPNTSKYNRHELISNTADKLMTPATLHKKLKKTNKAETHITKPRPMHQIVESSIEALTAINETIKTTSTTRRPYKARDIPIKADITGILNNNLFLRASQEIKASNDNIPTALNKANLLRRMNSEELSEVTETTGSYLQLIDLVKNDTKMTIDLEAITEPPVTESKELNHTNFKYSFPEFWNHPSNDVQMITTNVFDTTVISTSTKNQELTPANYVTTVQRQKSRKKKPKRRRISGITTAMTITPPPTSTKTITPIPTTTTEATTNEITLTKKTEYRKINDEIDDFNNSIATTVISSATRNNESKYGETKLDEYYNYDNVTEYDNNATISGLGRDMIEFLDKHNIKLNKNDTEIDINAVNNLVGSDIGKDVKHDIKSELRDEKARMRLDQDMMKMYGKTVSHITISTTPWNTLYTDPIEGLNDLLI